MLWQEGSSQPHSPHKFYGSVVGDLMLLGTAVRGASREKVGMNGGILCRRAVIRKLFVT